MNISGRRVSSSGGKPDPIVGSSSESSVRPSTGKLFRSAAQQQRQSGQRLRLLPLKIRDDQARGCERRFLRRQLHRI